MTEVYDSWMANLSISQLLVFFDLDALDLNLQLLLEQAVDHRDENYPFRKKLGAALDRKPATLRIPIKTLANAVESQKWGKVGGTDPTIASDGIHRKGLSHLQSSPDNTA